MHVIMEANPDAINGSQALSGHSKDESHDMIGTN